jgi:hypothetical protein
MNISKLNKHNLLSVGEIWVDFVSGEIKGNFEAGALSNGQLARAFRRLAKACDIAKDEGFSWNYLDLDEGKLSSRRD